MTLPSESASGVEAHANIIRVLFVVDSAFPGAGGAEAQAQKLAAALSKKGAAVEFVSPRILANHAVNDTVGGLPSHRIDYPKIRSIGAVILLLKFAWYLFKRRKDFDIIHVHITRLLAATAVAMRPLTGVPVVAKISGFFEFEGGVLDTKSRSIGNRVLRFILRKIDYVQTISVQTQEKLIQAGFSDRQIRFIPNGIDGTQAVERANSGPTNSKQTLVFGYCGRLRLVKGIDVLIDAFAALVKLRPELDVKLRIAGGGSAQESFMRRCEQLGVAEQIEWLGRIEDTAAFYQNLDVYIQPSFAEGLPNSVMEAMLAGLPVLATDIGGNNELIEHDQQGWLFAPGDANALSVLMQRCADDRAALLQLGPRGREKVIDTYDFESVTSELLDLYRGK